MKMYVVLRVDTRCEFLIKRKSIHIYSKKSSNKETMMKYYEQIKETYPSRMVVLTTEEKAIEAQKKCKIFYDEKERIALNAKKRISVLELDKKLNNIYVAHLAKENF